jgi:hypothetical protein
VKRGRPPCPILTANCAALELAGLNPASLLAGANRKSKAPRKSLPSGSSALEPSGNGSGFLSTRKFKTGPKPKGGTVKDLIGLAEIEAKFHLPQNMAAHELGISDTCLKKCVSSCCCCRRICYTPPPLPPTTVTCFGIVRLSIHNSITITDTCPVFPFPPVLPLHGAYLLSCQL